MVVEGNYKPGFRIELHIKDLANVLAAAKTYEVPVPLSEIIIEMMKSLQSQGHGADDHGGLIQYYEQQAGTLVRT
jgi:2-hydroxy-3-oxopropionate reductase